MNDLLFTIDQKNLVKCMEKVKKFRDNRPITPFVNYILIKSDGENIYYSASDLENTASLKFDGIYTVSGPFEICIENTFTLPLATESVNVSFIHTNENICTMLSPGGKVTVPLLPPEGFPAIPEKDEKIFDIGEGMLHEILSTIAPFAHPEAILSNNSLHFAYEEKTLRIGATDKFTSCATSVPITAKEGTNFMISQQSAILIKNILDPVSKNMCHVSAHKNDIIFKAASGAISCRRMVYGDMAKGNDYYRLSMPYISKEADLMEVTDKKYFLGQLHKATVFNTHESQLVEITLEKNKIIFEVADKMLGRRSVQELNVLFKHKGETKKIVFRPDQLQKIVQNIHNSSFVAHMPLENGPGKEEIGLPMSIEDHGYIYIIQPFVL